MNRKYLLNISRRSAMLVLAGVCFLSTLGAASTAFTGVAEAKAVACNRPIYNFGRAKWCGYFFNRGFDTGKDVRPGGVPGSVATVQTLVNMIFADLGSGNNNRITGAAFVIYTMLGYPAGVGNPHGVTWPIFNEWQTRVLAFGSTFQNGSVSTGSSGSIVWHEGWYTGGSCFPNTYYQTLDDVAPFCDNSQRYQVLDTIVFRDLYGNELYRIRRACMNPIGALYGLPVSLKYTLTPSTTGVVIRGGVAIPGNVAQVGDTIRFTHTVNNSGPTPSQGTTCALYGNSFNGYVATPGTPRNSSNGGYAPPPANCPPSFPLNATTVLVENFPVTVANKTICRSMYVSPATEAGGSKGSEACVLVANQPYLSVLGGDVSVGGGLETAPDTCPAYAPARIISWNNRAAGGWSGAGVQYAAMAMNTITDFASAQGNAGGAPAPTSLSFTNTSTNSAAGNFGGNFDSLKCIADYYGRKPSATSALSSPINISPTTVGDYSASGNVTITGGNVNPDQRTTLYVNGDVFITGNITYPGSWNVHHIPSFTLVVKGNIYISNNVTQLDGLYVAQRSAGAATGGTVYTCAAGFAAPALDGALYNACLSKLTVNGAMVANSIEFLRTFGTVSVAGSGAETFNYTPALWIAQPDAGAGGTNKYDAITSLPPVL